MKITEIARNLKHYIGTITQDGTWGKTTVFAESVEEARQVLASLYGSRNVLSVDLSESPTGTQTLTPDQLKLKSLADQRDQIAQNVKRERARQKMVKAQQAMQKANANPLPSRTT